MVIIRPLMRDELNKLLDEAPESETRNLKRYLAGNRLDCYDFFNEKGIEQLGMLLIKIKLFLIESIKV